MTAAEATAEARRLKEALDYERYRNEEFRKSSIQDAEAKSLIAESDANLSRLEAAYRAHMSQYPGSGSQTRMPPEQAQGEANRLRAALEHERYRLNEFRDSRARGVPNPEIDAFIAQAEAQVRNAERAYQDHQTLHGADGQARPRMSEGQARTEAGRLESELSEARAGFEAAARARDHSTHDTDASLAAVRSAQNRMRQAEAAYLDHLATYDPAARAGYVAGRQTADRANIAPNETIRDTVERAPAPADRPTLDEYEGRPGTNPAHLTPGGYGRDTVLPPAQRAPAAPPTPALPTYTPPNP